MIKTIMPCYNVSEQFINLTDLAIQSIKPEHLILIDNASTCGAGQLREWADTYIRNKTNLGYARAVNQGLKLCDDIAVVANNDIRVSPNWLEVTNEILKDPKVGSIHFRMIPYNQPFNPGNDTWIGGKERWCTASFFVVRNVQLYDENFLNSCDDWDFFKRLRKAGYKQAYTNKAEYQHMDSFTQQVVSQREEQDRKNKEYFREKWGLYPEEDFEKDFPGELAKPWKPQP
jgi:GT2 family glycosyltransferase